MHDNITIDISSFSEMTLRYCLSALHKTGYDEISLIYNNPRQVEILQDMIGSIPGVRLIQVGNGFSAGAKLVEEQPDLILLDFLMPELDGFEFSRFVRQDPRFKDVPIIAVTGLKSDSDRAKLKDAGVNDILTKPFTEEGLQEKIEQFRVRGGKSKRPKAA